MNLTLYKTSHADAVKQLFTAVFTDSEGAEEGQRIGQLAFDLQATTAPEDIVGCIAQDEEAIIGCIFFTRLRFEQPLNAFILAPVAIATAYQNQGIGQQLIHFGIEHLKKQQVEWLFTYGDPQFYAKVGFHVISEQIAKAPLSLTYPEGWLAQSLTAEELKPIRGHSRCVEALSKQEYW